MKKFITGAVGVLLIFCFGLVFIPDSITININTEPSMDGYAYADSVNIPNGWELYPGALLVSSGQWTFHRDTAVALPDTFVFFPVDSSGSVWDDPDMIQWLGDYYRRYPGQLIVYNSDPLDTLQIRVGGSSDWITVMPSNSSFTFNPFLHDTIFHKSSGTDTVFFDYLFTQPRVKK